MSRRSPHRSGPALLALVLAVAGVAAPASEGEAGAGTTRVSPPQLVLGSQVPPEFPPAAKAGRFGGAVTMEVTITPTGEVDTIEILDCTHKKLGFEEASIAAVEKWKFEPATTEDGTRVEATIRFRLSFNRARPGSPDTVSVSPFSAGGGPQEERAAERRRVRASSPSGAAASKPN